MYEWSSCPFVKMILPSNGRITFYLLTLYLFLKSTLKFIYSENAIKIWNDFLRLFQIFVAFFLMVWLLPIISTSLNHCLVYTYLFNMIIEICSSIFSQLPYILQMWKLIRITTYLDKILKILVMSNSTSYEYFPTFWG